MGWGKFYCGGVRGLVPGGALSKRLTTEAGPGVDLGVAMLLVVIKGVLAEGCRFRDLYP